MIYRLLVKRFKKNVERTPLLNDNGSPATEIVTVSRVETQDIIAMDEHGHQRKLANGQPLLVQENVIVRESKEVVIIPDYIPAGEFSVYQEVDEATQTSSGYTFPDGSPFYFASDVYRYESEIVETIK